MYYILHHHHLFWKSLFLLCSARVGHLPKKMSLHIFLNITYSGCRLSNCMSSFMHSIPPSIPVLAPTLHSCHLQFLQADTFSSAFLRSIYTYNHTCITIISNATYTWSHQKCINNYMSYEIQLTGPARMLARARCQNHSIFYTSPHQSLAENQRILLTCISLSFVRSAPQSQPYLHDSNDLIVSPVFTLSK